MGDSHADISKHVKSYILVFITLAVFTVITVLVSRIDLGSGVNVALALLIATFKASLVAAIFMHLKWEKSIYVWWPLILCAVFFIFLMLLPVLAVSDLPPGVKIGTWG